MLLQRLDVAGESSMVALLGGLALSLRKQYVAQSLGGNIKRDFYL